MPARNPNDLTEMERRFCLELMAMDKWNLAEAARRAGSTGRQPSVVAHKMMKRPRVQAFLRQLQTAREVESRIDAEQVWRKVWAVMELDPLDYCEKSADGWWLVKDLDLLPTEVRKLITQLKPTSLPVGSGRDIEYRPVTLVKFVDKQKMTELAAYHLIPAAAQRLQIEAVQKKVVEFVALRNSPPTENEVSELIEQELAVDA